MSIVAHTRLRDLASDQRAVRAVSELVVQKSLVPKLSKQFTVIPGISGRQQIAATKVPEYIVKKAGTNCSVTADELMNDVLSQEWNPYELKVNLKLCHRELEQSWMQWLLAKGYNMSNVSDAEFLEFIIDLISKGIEKDIHRIILLGDKDIASQNILNDANKVNYYNVIEKGLVPTLEYFKTIPQLQDRFVDNQWNGLTSTTDQYNVDGQKVFELLEELVNDAEVVGDQLQVVTNWRLYSAYKKFLRTNYLTDGSRQDITAGADYSIDGIPIQALKHYDQWRKKDFEKDNGAGGKVIHKPHFAIAIDKSFLGVAIDDPNALTDLRIEYPGGSDENNYIKARFRLDFKILNPFAFKASI